MSKQVFNSIDNSVFQGLDQYNSLTSQIEPCHLGEKIKEAQFG